MYFGFALLGVLEFLVNQCNGKTSTELFTSNTCKKSAVRLYEDDTYFLIWYGQITPNLCNFTFKRGGNTDDICFQSEVFDLHYSMGDVKIQITDNTNYTWKYDIYTNKIQRKCVVRPYYLNVSIHVPNGYNEPSVHKYIELRFTGITDADESSNDVSSVILFVISGIVMLILFFCCSGKGKECRNNSGIREIPENCLGVLCGCITCKCLRGCEGPSCDCQVQDICKPCGECCTAWAGCCTMMVVRARQDDINQSSNTGTEMRGLPEDNTQVSTTGIAVTSLSSDSIVPPPSYGIATDMVIIDPTCPPPSYEEVIANTSPSAPPWSK